jgi:hypothetical protein
VAERFELLTSSNSHLTTVGLNPAKDFRFFHVKKRLAVLLVPEIMHYCREGHFMSFFTSKSGMSPL